MKFDKEYKHQWYLKNKERLKNIYKDYYTQHKEYYAKYHKKYYKDNLLKLQDKHKKYRIINIKHINKVREKYNTSYKKEIALYKKSYRKILVNRIADNLRSRLYMALKTNKKASRTLDLIGCSLKFFKKHLESQFTEGMKWSNYGKWEIDHIRPCASFDLSKSEEQSKCFHYSNLQPLWEEDNIRKSSKY